MSGLFADEPDEGGKLTVDLLLWRSRNVVHRVPKSIAIDPLAEIYMKADAKVRVLHCVRSCVYGSGPTNHQASTGHDPIFVRDRNAAVDRLAAAEVVCINDEHAVTHVSRRE